uniref:Uncharacterized protein n=1 Tax=Rhizophagus irregularis (strain DAOM 181602 / DAOM 197198 / MUCL 43194) TaxID=747089 RepID=U9TSF4_RHIID
MVYVKGLHVRVLLVRMYITMRPFFGRRSEPTTPLVISILIIDVVQDTPIIKTSFVDFDAIRPPRFIFKSDYNFTIITCLENHIKINATQSTHVDYKSDITHPDETYGPSQLYLGFYQPSPGVFFYEYNEPDEMIDLIIMVLVVNDDNYTPDQPVQAITAFDSGKVIKVKPSKWSPMSWT